MASKRMIVIVTALILSAGVVPSQAAYTLSQLEQIEQFILNGQWALLKAYLDANPDLLDGSDALAVELRDFVRTVAATGTIPTILPPATVPDLKLVAAARDSY